MNLATVNRRINAGVTYADMPANHWADAQIGGSANCNGYALAKRRALLDAGTPIDKLHLCRCWTEQREAHLVLLVETDDAGWLILDNRYPEPMRRQDLAYQWSMMETEGQWFAVVQ